MFGKKTPSEEELREELTETIRVEVAEELREEIKEEVEEKIWKEAYNKGYFFGYDDAKTKYEVVDRVKKQEERLVAQDPNMHDMYDDNVTYEDVQYEKSSGESERIFRKIQAQRAEKLGAMCKICSEFLIENECPNAHNHAKYTNSKYD